jgi:CheY-like chemotaxis protein
MAPDATILIADDDAGHARLLMKNLQRSGLQNPIDRFENGQQVLDFLFCRGNRTRINKTAYILLMDIRMPQIDGVEVLRQIKGDAELKKNAGHHAHDYR